MNFLIILLGSIFTIFSIIILSYMSIATILGPWIAPTIILLSIGISETFRQMGQKSFSVQDLIKIQSVGAVGGIIATAIGFSLPVIFFLEPNIFSQWMDSPIFFCCMVGTLCLAGGALGLCIGRIFSKTLIKKNALPFPVSQLTYQVATAKDQTSRAKALFWGVLTTLGILALRDGVWKYKGILSKNITLFPSIFENSLAINISPTLWAIGYSTGLQTLLPILIGMLSKYLILYPINHHSCVLPITLFKPYSPIQFAFGFCSGILLYDIAHAIPWHNDLIHGAKQLCVNTKSNLYDIAKTLQKFRIKKGPRLPLISSIIIYAEPVIAVILSYALLSYFEFSIPAQIALILFSIIATYQICLISGKIGLVQFGRFATFVALPLYMIFDLNFVQVTIVGVFFNICAAVASDLLFDYKSGALSNIKQITMHRYQWIGLFVSAISAGLIFWLLFTHLKIGTPELFAQRAQAKAAIIQTFNFDKYVVALGFLFAFVLKKFKISPAMTFGGILMPNNMVFALLAGGLVAHFTKKKNEPSLNDFFSAGVFSSESIWIFINIVSKIFI